MTATATAPADLGRNHEGARRDEFLSVRTLTATALRINEIKRLGLSGSRIRKLVRRFVTEGRADVDFHTWFIAYADPTGERAVSNVLRERGF